MKVGLRTRGGAKLDHRFALNRDRVRIIWIQEKRLVRHSDRLAEQMLFLGHPSHVRKRAAVARIDRESGFEQVFGLLQLAGRNELARLMLQLDGLRQDLIIGPLARDRRRKRKSGKSNEQKSRQGTHQSLQVSPLTSMAGEAARRKSRPSDRGQG